MLQKWQWKYQHVAIYDSKNEKLSANRRVVDVVCVIRINLMVFAGNFDAFMQPLQFYLWL